MTGLRRVLALVLSFVLIASVVPMTFASGTLEIRVTANKTEVSVGDMVEFTYTLRGADQVDGGIEGYGFSVVLGAGLKYVGFEIPSEANDTFAGASFNEDNLFTGCMGSNSGSYTGSSIDLLIITCEVVGDKGLEATANNGDLTDGNFDSLVPGCAGVTLSLRGSDITTTTTTGEDGTVTIVATDENGKVVSIEITISSRVSEEAAKSGEAVKLDIDAMEADEDLPVTITTNNNKEVAVEVPVANVTPGCVIVIVDAEGNETIVTDTKMTEDGLVFACPDGATIKVVDNSVSFADIKGNNWYNDAVDFVSARGIMTGMPGNAFEQGGLTTRAQLWTMLARLSGVDTTCTEGNWYDVARAWAMENGISDGSDANGKLTREMLVTMLFRFVGEKGESKSIEGFTDAANASAWAKAALEWAYGEGVMNGNTDGTMNPTGETTRAQMAQFFMNFIQNI